MTDGKPMDNNAGGQDFARKHRIDGTPPNWEKIARFLWCLLDDIDTLDDACKDNDTAFRNAARAKQRRRFEVSDSDGYTVQFYD